MQTVSQPEPAGWVVEFRKAVNALENVWPSDDTKSVLQLEVLRLRLCRWWYAIDTLPDDQATSIKEKSAAEFKKHLSSIGNIISVLPDGQTKSHSSGDLVDELRARALTYLGCRLAADGAPKELEEWVLMGIKGKVDALEINDLSEALGNLRRRDAATFDGNMASIAKKEFHALKDAASAVDDNFSNVLYWGGDGHSFYDTDIDHSSVAMGDKISDTFKGQLSNARHRYSATCIKNGSDVTMGNVHGDFCKQVDKGRDG